MEEIKKTQFYSIDIVKTIMAVIVVAIHRPPFKEGTFIYYFRGQILGGLAVPFFLIVSSFLLFSKIKKKPEKSNEYVKKNLWRLFKLYLIWSVIYIPCSFVRRFTGHYEYLTFKLVIGEIISYIKDFFLGCSFMHLWFLSALFVSILITYLLSRKLSYKAILIISLVLCAVYKLFLLLPDLFPLVSKVANGLPSIVSNFLSRGFVCVALGLFTANIKFDNKKVVIVILSVLLILYFGFSYYNYSFIKNDLLADVVITAFCFLIPFIITQLCLNITLSPLPIYGYLRKISILIYFTHFLLMKEAFAYLKFLTGIELFEKNWFTFLFDFCFAFALSNLILFLQDKKGFRWMKNLY